MRSCLVLFCFELGPLFNFTPPTHDRWQTQPIHTYGIIYGDFPLGTQGYKRMVCGGGQDMSD